jgi:hypothetical protein
MISFVLKSCNMVAHYMATTVAKEQIEGIWSSNSFDDVLKSIALSKEQLVIHSDN